MGLQPSPAARGPCEEPTDDTWCQEGSGMGGAPTSQLFPSPAGHRKDLPGRARRRRKEERPVSQPCQVDVPWSAPRSPCQLSNPCPQGGRTRTVDTAQLQPESYGQPGKGRSPQKLTAGPMWVVEWCNLGTLRCQGLVSWPLWHHLPQLHTGCGPGIRWGAILIPPPPSMLPGGVSPPCSPAA